MKNKKILRVLALCTFPIAAAASFFAARNLLAIERNMVYLADEVVIDTTGYPCIGEADAPVSAVVCFDFMCVYCDSLHTLLDSIESRYRGRVKIHEKPYALLNRRSEVLARALLASGRQNGYDRILGPLFALAPGARAMSVRSIEDTIGRIAVKLDLDGKRLLRDMRSRQVRKMIESGRAEARLYGIHSVPLFFMGPYMLRGYRSRTEYETCIENVLDVTS